MTPSVEIARMIIGTIAGLSILGLDIWFWELNKDDADYPEVWIAWGGIAAGIGLIAYAVGGMELLQKLT